MLFSNIIGELTGSVGNGLANQSSDIKKVKDGLSNLGLFKDNEIEDQDFITRDLDKGIKSFQRDKNLKVDGRLFPKGETERELFNDNLVSTQPKKSKQKPQTNPLLNLVEQIIKPKSVAQSDVIADLKDKQSLTSEDVPTPSRKPTIFDGTPAPTDATGRVVSDFIFAPTYKAVDKVKVQKELDFDHNKGGGDFHSLLKYGFKPGSIADEASKIAEKEFPKQKGYADDQDAFRHAVGSYLMTQRYGDKNAKEILDRHERSPSGGLSPQDTEGSLLQDLYNNRIGREAALDPKNKGRDPAEVIKELYNEGKLQTRPFRIKRE